MAGKLQTSTSRSYAYVFNAKTTEYYRCAATVTVTKDKGKRLHPDPDRRRQLSQKREQLFPTDCSYSFDAAETEGPNTNSFFGPGGFVIWVGDNTKLAAKACFSIAIGGNQPDVQRCVDMKFE